MRNLMMILVFAFATAARSATLYFYSDDQSDFTWETVANWWTDAEHTSAAGQIPTTGDDVVIVDSYGAVLYSEITPNTCTTTGYSALFLDTGAEITGGTFTNICIYDNYGGGAIISGGTFGADVDWYFDATVWVTGGTFNSEPYSPQGGAIIEGATFNAYAYWIDTLFGDVTYNADSGHENTLIQDGTWNGDVEYDDYQYSGTVSGSSTEINATLVAGGYLTIQDVGYVHTIEIIQGSNPYFYGADLGSLESAKFYNGAVLYKNRGINGSSILGMQ